jgi:phosphoribosylanthranilate isomerase
MSLWIKICGNTSLADALVAAGIGAPTDRSSSVGWKNGADALGFVFAPSPRRVTPEQAAEMVRGLPAAIEKIGVFVEASFDEIAATVATAGLTGVQLHWPAPAELTEHLRARFGTGLRILRVVHFGDASAAHPAMQRGFASSENLFPEGQEVSGHGLSRAGHAQKDEGALAPAAGLFDSNADAILVDARVAGAAGGTGKSYDWAKARQALFGSAKGIKFVAAGGLSPENLAEAIRTLRPWGVDAVSGVEAAPGRKDAAKVRAFIERARAAED